mgnify:CR=1 FL=1
MRRQWPLALALLGGMALALWFLPKEGAPPPRVADGAPRIHIEVPKPPKEKGLSKEAECASGCSMKKHPVPPFTVEDFKKTLAAFSRQRLPLAGQESSPEVDRLVFYGRRTRALLQKEREAVAALPKGHGQWLRRQLAHDHALVALRIIDDAGRVRAHLPWRRVPFGDKRHLHPKTVDIQPMSFNGTVMRTGLGHIWARY